MKSRLVLIFISVILLILDNSAAPFINIQGAYPSILFVFAIAYSIINGKEEAVFIGVVSGLLQDIYFINGIGVNALINMFLCLLAAIIGESIFKNKKLIPIITCAIISFLKVICVFVIFYFIDLSIEIKTSLFTALYNTIIMFLGYKYVLKLSNTKFMKREWRFK